MTLRADDDRYEIELAGPQRTLVVHAQADFEEALLGLRDELEAQGLLLQCNRYRRDAFVSSLARQMSEGLSCYLVRPGVPVDPDQLVDSLGPAPTADVVTAAEAHAFIEEWKRSFDGEPKHNGRSPT